MPRAAYRDGVLPIVQLGREDVVQKDVEIYGRAYRRARSGLLPQEERRVMTGDLIQVRG